MSAPVLSAAQANPATASFTSCGITYEISIDSEGRATARSFNKKHKIWVTLSFSQIGDEEAVQNILDTLKRDYIAKHVNHDTRKSIFRDFAQI